MLRASRRAPLNGVRYNSGTSDAASKAKDTASKTANKAAEGLSRVSSAAGPAISGAAKGIAGSLSKVGGRTGKVVNFVERTCAPGPHCAAPPLPSMAGAPVAMVLWG